MSCVSSAESAYYILEVNRIDILEQKKEVRNLNEAPENWEIPSRNNETEIQ